MTLPLESVLLGHMILNGKGSLTGCGLHGYSLLPFFSNKLIKFLTFFSSIFGVLSEKKKLKLSTFFFFYDLYRSDKHDLLPCTILQV